MVGAGVLGRGVGGAVVAGGGVLTTGAEVCGAGVAVAGADVAGAVETVIVGVVVTEADAEGDGDGDGEPLVAPTDPRANRSSTKTRMVARLPATAASARSTQRGPRRGGGMTLVVSERMPAARARAMPRAGSRRPGAAGGTV